LIRLAILAERSERAQDLADALAVEHDFEITYTGVSKDIGWQDPYLAEVWIVAGLPDRSVGGLGLPMVVLTDTPESNPLAGNVRAWLPMNSSPRQIAAAVVAAANGLFALTPAQVKRWRGTQAPLSEELLVEHLTPREMEVLGMLSDGLANKEIAARLEVSNHTVKFHVSQILAKLGASTRAEAVAMGMRRGLVPV
jgi:DNA-binding CsgD family transcriptional regulator